MTPWQFKLAVQEHTRIASERHDFHMSLVWTGANFNAYAYHDPKKLPPLKKFLTSAFSSKKRSKKIDEVAILARFKAYQQARAEKNGNKKKNRG